MMPRISGRPSWCQETTTAPRALVHLRPASAFTVTEELTGTGRPGRSTPREAVPPIAEYGFCPIASVRAGGARGAVEWMCLPRMDSPSVFAACLDRGAGSFRLGPADLAVPAGRRPAPDHGAGDTWATPTGWAVVRDVLLIGPWVRLTKIEYPRPDAHRSQRRARPAADGAVPERVDRLHPGMRAAFDYARQPGVWRYTGTGYSERNLLGDGQRSSG